MSGDLIFEHLPVDRKDSPESWSVVPLGDVAADIQTGFASGKHNRDGTGIPHLRPMNISPDGEVDLSDVRFVTPDRGDKRLVAGDVLFNNTNSPVWVGKTALIESEEELAFSNHMTRLRFPSVVRPPFVAHQLHFFCRSGYFQHQCKKHVNQASISRTFLSKSTPFFLPPLNEQRRIVARIDALQARSRRAREALDAVPALLDRFRQSVLAAAFRGDLTADWRAKQPPGSVEPASVLLKRLAWSRKESERAMDQVAPRRSPLPNSWEWSHLRLLCAKDEAFCYGVVQPGKRVSGGVRLVRAGDLVDGSVDESELRTVHPDVDSSYRRSRLVGGEVLVTVVGAGVGASAMVPMSCAGANIARAIAKVPIRSISARYVYYWLTASQARYWMRTAAREVARPTLNLKELSSLPVPVPPLAEQMKIVGEIDRLARSLQPCARAQSMARGNLDTLDQAILAKAFRGELVPQDPDDEPASALLERIKAELDAAAPTKRRGRRKRS